MGSAEIQGEIWGAAARDWADLQEPAGRPLWLAMLTAAGVAAGTRMLDAGCGAGGASLMAAERGAIVFGFDASAPLLAIARERVPGGEFFQGDLEALPYASGSFDCAFACNAIQFAQDPVRALSELKRVTKSGGSVVIGLWGRPEQCEASAIFAATRNALPHPPASGGPFALSAPEMLERVMNTIGLKVGGGADIPCPFVYPDLATAWRAQIASGPSIAAIRAIGLERFRAALMPVLESFRKPSGEIRIENVWRFVLGRV